MKTIKKPVKKAQYGMDMPMDYSTMKSGGSLKAVDKAKKPGLAKLPTAVRNKMGYQKNGGVTKAKSGASIKKAGFGNFLGKVGKGLGKAALGFTGLGVAKALFGKKKRNPMAGTAQAPIGAPTGMASKAPMKKGGAVKKAGMHKMPNGSMMKNSSMKSGGKMAKCRVGCN
jgi:hypothetical protein